jgi:hypothetical protein
MYDYYELRSVIRDAKRYRFEITVQFTYRIVPLTGAQGSAVDTIPREARKAETRATVNCRAMLVACAVSCFLDACELCCDLCLFRASLFVLRDTDRNRSQATVGRFLLDTVLCGDETMVDARFYTHAVDTSENRQGSNCVQLWRLCIQPNANSKASPHVRVWSRCGEAMQHRLPNGQCGHGAVY